MCLYLPPSSFSRTTRERVRVSPRKVDIFVRKKERKKRVFVTRCTRVASGPRANEAVPNVRAPAVARRTTERGRMLKGEGRELGVKQRWSRRENENHASAYDEGRGGGERGALSLPESGNLTTTARKGKRGRVKRTLIICAFRTSEEQKAPRIL